MLHHARRARPGRVQQYLIKSLRCPGLTGNIFFQIFMKKDDIFQAITLCVPLGLGNQRRYAFHTHHALGAAGKRQRKIAHSAKQIQYPVSRLHIQPFQRPRHHLLIHRIIHLNKVARTKG